MTKRVRKTAPACQDIIAAAIDVEKASGVTS
jgi:hypothetical protein